MAKRVANKPIDDGLTKEAHVLMGTLVAQAGTEAVRRKLRNLNRTCEHVVASAATSFSVPVVVKAYASICDDTIGESTIRNKCGGNNPYQKLYRRWEIVAAAKVATVKPGIAIDAGIIGDHEIMAIENPRLQHQIALLAHQNRSLHHQLIILRNEQCKVPLRIEGVPFQPGGVDLVLSDDEIEAVRDFVDADRMNAKHLLRTKQDGVKLKDGRAIADPGFVSALEKIVKSYERQ